VLSQHSDDPPCDKSNYTDNSKHPTGSHQDVDQGTQLFLLNYLLLRGVSDIFTEHRDVLVGYCICCTLPGRSRNQEKLVGVRKALPEP